MSSIKPSKGDTDSDIKIKRTVFKEYKECSKIPSKVHNQKRNEIKRGSQDMNKAKTNIDDNAIIQKEKQKPAQNRIIKKIAESLDAWQTNKRLKKGRNKEISTKDISKHQYGNIKKESISEERFKNLHQYFPKPEYIVMNKINLEMKEDGYDNKPKIYVPILSEQ